MSGSRWCGIATPHHSHTMESSSAIKILTSYKNLLQPFQQNGENLRGLHVAKQIRTVKTNTRCLHFRKFDKVKCLEKLVNIKESMMALKFMY